MLSLARDLLNRGPTPETAETGVFICSSFIYLKWNCSTQIE